MKQRILLVFSILSLFTEGLRSQSDNNPPVLNSFTISESCIDVSNNTVDIMFKAEMTDDFSGIDNVFLSYTNSNIGSSVAMPIISGDSLNGIYEVLISYDNTDLEDLYLYGLNASDKFGNFINYIIENRDLLAAGYQDSLKVINIYSDNTPPALNNFTISESCIDVSNNTVDVTYTAELTDDISGINNVSLSYTNSNIGSSLNMPIISGDSLSGIYQVTITYDNTNLQDLYLYGLNVTDNFGNYLNYAIYNRGLQNAGYQDSLKLNNIYSDNTLPVLNNFTISESCINVSNNTVDVTYTAELTDDLSGINDVSLVYENSSIGFSIPMPIISGDALNGLYEVTISYDNANIESVYFHGLSVADNFGNFLNYSTYNRDLLTAGFQDSLVVINCPVGIETQLDALRITDPLSGLVHKALNQNCYRTTVNDSGVLESNQIACDNSIGDICIECGSLFINSNDPHLLLTSPNGSCWKIIVDNSGVVQTVATSCQTFLDFELQDGDLYFEYRPSGKSGPILKSSIAQCWQITLNNQNQAQAIAVSCP